MHDKPFNAKVINKIVPLLRKRGYVFETLDHYPEHSYTFTSVYSQYKPDIPAEKIEFTDTEIKIKTDGTYQLKVRMTPEKSTDFIVWESSDTAVAETDKSGKIKATGIGEAVITAKTSSGRTAACKVTVVSDDSQ